MLIINFHCFKSYKLISIVVKHKLGLRTIPRLLILGFAADFNKAVKLRSNDPKPNFLCLIDESRKKRKSIRFLLMQNHEWCSSLICILALYLSKGFSSPVRYKARIQIKEEHHSISAFKINNYYSPKAK